MLPTTTCKILTKAGPRRGRRYQCRSGVAHEVRRDPVGINCNVHLLERLQQRNQCRICEYDRNTIACRCMWYRCKTCQTVNSQRRHKPRMQSMIVANLHRTPDPMPYVWLATNCTERVSLHEYHTQSIPPGVSCIQLSHSKYVHDVSPLPLRSWVMGVPVASRIQNPIMWVMAQVFEQTWMMGLSACGCSAITTRTHNTGPNTSFSVQNVGCTSPDPLTNTFTRFGEVLNRIPSLAGLRHSLLNTVSFVLGSCIKPTLRR
jgi:hypothetical protein